MADERALPLMWLMLMLGAAIVGAVVIAWKEQGSSGGAVTAGPMPQARLQTESPAAPLDEPLPITFPIYLTGEGRIESVTLEQYVRGVVAAEMPIEFELEALKAQAIAARTYIARRFEKKDVSNMPVDEAWVTDSVAHQAYLTDGDIMDKWTGPEREANLAKLDRAVRETRNLIMTHEGEPILAVYFSTSNGYTENSEDYWSEPLPYLRSVESGWDRNVSPKFRTEIRMPVDEFADKLGVDGRKAGQIRVLERTAGRRVANIRIGGVTFTGREVREKLGLPSTGFTIRVDGSEAVITVTGHGHGVGMSQYGAQGMALAGYKAEDILAHYYSGITIERYKGPDLALAGASGEEQEEE
jgi:stage II sporulation protein D